MKNLLHSSSVLKLNNCWMGVEYISPKDAFRKMFNDKNSERVKGLDVRLNSDGSISPETRSYNGESWMRLPVNEGDPFLGLPHGNRVRVPLVVIVPTYNKLPKVKLQLNKRGLFTRDRGKCCYCNKVLTFDEATKDHIVPSSRGGLTTWLNCVLSCQPCNGIKADKSLKESRLILIRKPIEPRESPILLELKKDAPKEHYAILSIA